MFGHPVLLCSESSAVLLSYVWAISTDLDYRLVFSFLFSIPCFWVIVTRPKFATSGRFVLVRSGLSLARYSSRQANAFVSSCHTI